MLGITFGAITVEIQEGTMGRNKKHRCIFTPVQQGQPVQHLKTVDAFYEPANVRVARFDGDTLAGFVVQLSIDRTRNRAEL